MSVLILMVLSLSGVYSDSHTLRYCVSGITAPGSGLPDFSLSAYVDDQQTERYTSDIQRRLPVAEWMKKEKPEYWNRRTWSSKANEAAFRHEVSLGKERLHLTEGFHFLQMIQSCELRDDGSNVSSEHYRYDGREYMYYDKPTGTFIPMMADAQSVTQRWNMPDIGFARRTKHYLESECIQRLKRFIAYGREELERRGDSTYFRPKVKVSHQESGEVTKLHCLVYGFHPRSVDVKWMKNGTDDVPTDESTPVLPNPDGTYQIRVNAEVIPKEDDSYSCYVDHSSLEEPLLVRWGELYPYWGSRSLSDGVSCIH
ncbi:major histocompatibility complex class I-related gene protein-like, partial [Dendropsophus ebraccatus]|uniref:major histocompatibility complex class I-related gene protein-like n=1 Tax=Dendropsophus ebraccatus TaxID=150705 RepID=UPI0038321B25